MQCRYDKFIKSDYEFYVDIRMSQNSTDFSFFFQILINIKVP